MEKQNRTLEMYDLVEQWQRSGKSQKQFSAGHNIKLATMLFGFWFRPTHLQYHPV